MEVITKMTGLRLLEEAINGNISCGTIVRCKNKNISDTMEIPIYDYYVYTKGDGRFHRCDEHGKLGAKGQIRYMCYANMKKEFEIIEEDKKIEKLPRSITDNACASKDFREMAKKINEIIDELYKSKGEEK